MTVKMRGAAAALACGTLFAIGATGQSASAQNPPAQQPASQTAPGAPASETHARGDISGDWQGTLQTPNRALRIVEKISKADKGWAVRMYSIDQGGQGFNGSSVVLDGSAFKFNVDPIGGTFEGTISADSNSIAGTWTQGPNPLPLNLVRATKETAWEIPPPPTPPKPMAADADPSFEVATIKPNDSGVSRMQQLTINGRNFVTKNASLGDLIGFAYEVQANQIVNPPDWINKDRYDIAAVPDQEGSPNVQQLRTMMQKLLTSRFNLKFHQDKRELSAYVLTVAKSGSKLKPTELKGTLPGLGMRTVPSGLTLIMANGRMQDFTSFLQMLVFDRPVVDRTELTGRYDLTVTFTPDDSQFNGNPPKPAPATDNTEPAPNLFTAFQEQLGLKLEAQKTQVDVIAIDHVEKPSPN